MLQIRDFTQAEKDRVEYVRDTKNLKKCDSSDILIGRYGASVGKILTGLAGAYNVAIVKTIPVDGLDKRYLFHFLKSDAFQRWLQTIATSRSAQAGFGKEDFKDLKIPLPPLSMQQQFVEIARKADETKAALKKSIVDVEPVIKGLINR